MAKKYRLVGSQDPTSRIEVVRVEGPSEDYPDGKVLQLDGDAVELSNDQVTKLAAFVRLEPSDDAEPEPQVVQQPGVEYSSTSTDVPPDLGRVPDIGELDKAGLVAELQRVRSENPTALPRLSESSNKEELQKGLRRYHGQEG